MSLTKPYLQVVGVLTLIFGLIYLLVPTAMTEPAGFGSLGGSALTDVRATYGGFQIGMGIFLLWTSRAPGRMRSGLVLLVLAIGSLFLSRILGVLMDGELSAFHMQGLAVESTMTALTLYLIRKSERDAAD
ncbi:MAG: DUF4345 domain-containing protein [Myxococcota bacterium]